MLLSIAVSGRGGAGLLAYYALEEIKKMGIEFELYAASGTSALACIVFLSDLARKDQVKILEEFSDDIKKLNKKETGFMSFGIDNQLSKIKLNKELYITAADIDSGVLYVFNKNSNINSEEIKTVSQFEFSQAVKATSALGGIENVFSLDGKRFVDSYFKTKTPQFPLRFRGGKKILNLDICDSTAHWYNFFYPVSEENKNDCTLKFCFEQVDIKNKEFVKHFQKQLREKQQYLYNKLILDTGE